MGVFQLFMMMMMVTSCLGSPFLGEIRWVGFNFAPRGWALCNGQTLPISQNSALFSLLGTTFGGDGRTTFGLPDVRSRSIVGEGSGPGLSNRKWGQKGGAERVTLNLQQIPGHTHQVPELNTGSEESSILPKVDDGSCESVTFDSIVTAEPADNRYSTTDFATSQSTGGNQAHENMHPYLTLHCIIALQGIFPSRS